MTELPETIDLAAWAIAGFAHGPGGSLLRAELTGSVNFPSRTFEVDVNVEAMFAATKAVCLGGAQFDFINARAKVEAPFNTDGLAAFTDRD